MARRKPGKNRTGGRGRGKRRSTGAGFLQKLLMAGSTALLVLCAASITWGFFFRHEGGEGRFRLEVRNGVGEPGLANRARVGLLRRGIDVIETGNAKRFDYEESVLIALREGVDVEELARLIGCRHWVVQLREDPLADAELILGSDYRDLRLDWDYQSDLFE